MIHSKKKLLSELVKFIEICQGNLLSGKIDGETYSLLADVKFEFLRNFLNSEINDMDVEKEISYRIKRLFLINSLIKGYYLPYVNKEVI